MRRHEPHKSSPRQRHPGRRSVEDLEACAQLLVRGDHERVCAVRAAPVRVSYNKIVCLLYISRPREAHGGVRSESPCAVPGAVIERDDEWEPLRRRPRAAAQRELRLREREHADAAHVVAVDENERRRGGSWRGRAAHGELDEWRWHAQRIAQRTTKRPRRERRTAPQRRTNRHAHFDSVPIE